MSQTVGKWLISTFEALQNKLGHEGMEGLGFSMDAAFP